MTGKNPLLDIALEARRGRAQRRLLRQPQAVPERRLLLRPDLPGDGLPGRDVHGAVRHPPHGRLAGPLGRAAGRQGPEDLAAPPGLHRPATARLRGSRREANRRRAAQCAAPVRRCSSRILPTFALDSMSRCASTISSIEKRRVDHRLQQALIEQRQHLAAELPADGDLLLERARPQHGADQSSPLVEQLPSVERRVAAAHRADLHDRALRRQRVEVALEVLAADDVEHDVDPASPVNSSAAATKSWLV